MYRCEYSDRFEKDQALITADSLSELFKAAAFVWKESAAEQSPFIAGRYEKLNLSAPALETLMIEFLSRLNGKLNNHFEFTGRIVKLEISQDEKGYSLTGIIQSGKVDFHSFPVSDEILSITVHEIEKFSGSNIYTAKVEFKKKK